MLEAMHHTLAAKGVRMSWITTMIRDGKLKEEIKNWGPFPTGLMDYATAFTSLENSFGHRNCGDNNGQRLSMVFQENVPAAGNTGAHERTIGCVSFDLSALEDLRTTRAMFHLGVRHREHVAQLTGLYVDDVRQASHALSIKHHLYTLAAIVARQLRIQSESLPVCI